MAGRRQKKGQTASITPRPLAKKKLSKAALFRILVKIAGGGTLLQGAKDEEVNYEHCWNTLTKKYPVEYARAKACGTEALVEGALVCAKNSLSENAAGDRNHLDFVKWLASRRSPGDYGDKQTVVMEKDERIIIDTGTWIAPTGSDDITVPSMEAGNEKKSDAPD